MKWTHEKIKKLPRKNMSIDEFINNAKRFGVKISRAHMNKIEDGTFLGVWKQKNGRFVRIHLQKIFFKTFNLQWSVTNKKGKKGRIGKELLISNMRLPRGDIKRF